MAISVEEFNKVALKCWEEPLRKLLFEDGILYTALKDMPKYLAMREEKRRRGRLVYKYAMMGGSNV